MATYRHWSVSLWRDPDDFSHCGILSPDKTEWRLISATLCGWRRCFVADQLYGSWNAYEKKKKMDTLIAPTYLLTSFLQSLLCTSVRTLSYVWQQQKPKISSPCVFNTGRKSANCCTAFNTSRFAWSGYLYLNQQTTTTKKLKTKCEWYISHRALATYAIKHLHFFDSSSFNQRINSIITTIEACSNTLVRNYKK